MDENPMWNPPGMSFNLTMKATEQYCHLISTALSNWFQNEFFFSCFDHNRFRESESVKVAIVCIVSFFRYSYFTVCTCVLSPIAAELRCHVLQLNTRHAPVVFRDIKVAQRKKNLHFQLSFNTLRILFTANFISNDKS